MGYGKINVWIRERKTCSVANVTGAIAVTQCCGRGIAEEKIVKGHAEVTVPPGCYIVMASFGKPVTAAETMVIVGCDKSACINFLVKESLTKEG